MKTVSLIQIPRYSDFLNPAKVVRLLTQYIGAYATRSVIKSILFYAVGNSTTEVVASLLTLTIQNTAVQYPVKNLIKSLEYSIKNKKNDIALLLLPYFKSLFRQVDPTHFQVRQFFI